MVARTLTEVIDDALALPRSERRVVVQRMLASLEEPDVPGGIVVNPQDLVEHGATYAFPANGRYRSETVALAELPGPSLSLPWGMVAVADPWFPEAAPSDAAGATSSGEQPTSVTTIARTRSDKGTSEPMAVAATIGPVADVTVWHPAVVAERHFHLDSDSSLGAFYDITDAALLQPLFEDSLAMQTVFNRALTELLVPLEADGRVVGVAFLSGKDLHPVWQGYDAGGVAVAVLVDLGGLALAQSRAGS